MAYKWIGSPNYSRGRGGQKVKYIVIHWMVGTLASTDSVFQNKSRNTSAHYGIENTKVHQYVREKDTAYHAGNYTINSQSIGIEHSAAPGRKATKSTYETSARLMAKICKEYGLNPYRAIKPHNKYTATQCPGTMDLGRLKKLTKQYMQGDKVVDKLKKKVKKLTQEVDAWKRLAKRRKDIISELKKQNSKLEDKAVLTVTLQKQLDKSKETVAQLEAKLEADEERGRGFFRTLGQILKETLWK